jgi:hypothetical protein
VTHQSYIVPLALTLALATGCAARRIPGTQIEDTAEAREILSVLDAYRRAVEAKDADGVLKLISKNFQDDGGTASPEDDLDYVRLTSALPSQFAKVDAVRLDMDIQRIDVDRGVAHAVYSYNASFRIPRLSTKPQKSSELEKMVLQRTDDGWKIVSGI